MEKIKLCQRADESEKTFEARWSRYQTRSRFVLASMTEHDMGNKCQALKQTCYKLESKREMNEVFQGSVSPSPLLSPIKNGYKSDLFDAYEIERISKELNYYVRVSNLEKKGGIGNDPKEAVLSKKRGKGLFWLRHGMVYCGSKVVHDVVDMNRKERGAIAGKE